MGDFLVVLGMLTALGAFLSWLGRTQFTLIVAYLVVGCVGGPVLYLGYEVYIISAVGNSYAESANKPFLIFLLELFDLRQLAIFLRVLEEDQRKVVIFVGTLVSAVAITLPFVTFANTVFAALHASDAKNAVDNQGHALSRELRESTSGYTQKHEEVIAKVEQLDTALLDISRKIDSLEAQTRKSEVPVEEEDQA